MIENKGPLARIRVAVIHVVVVVLGILCFFPLWNVFCLSLSDSKAITQNMVSIFPVNITLVAYEKIIDDARFWTSFFVSVKRVVAVVVLSMPLMLMSAYAFTKTRKEFKGRDLFMTIMLVAMLFSGGMVPTFLWFKALGLLNNFWVMVLPSLIVSSHIIMMMNFMKGLPYSIEEAAIVDGATPWQVLWRIVVPCSKPVIATITLFVIVGHWNDFMTGVLYLYKSELQPLMQYIQGLNTDFRALAEAGDFTAIVDAVNSGISGTALNSAKIFVAMLPLLAIYPFLQKYLITGLVLGSVKE